MYETNKYTASATMSVSGSAAMIRMERTYMSRRRFGDLFDFIQAMCLPDRPQAGGVNIKITYLVKVTKAPQMSPYAAKYFDLETGMILKRGDRTRRLAVAVAPGARSGGELGAESIVYEMRVGTLEYG
jgi:hypothetical protein